MQPPEGRKQRWMDVEMPVTPTRHEAFAVQAHEPGITEKLDASLVERIIENCIELLARSEILVIDDKGRNESGFGAQQSSRARHVRYHENDLGRIVMEPAGFNQ